MTYLLHIDTSTDTGLLALSCDGALLGSLRNTETRNHAARINLMIEELVEGHGIKIADLSGVVVNAGPGSYTGLRIGVATAKGICFALDLPLLADNRLDLLTISAFYNRTYQYEWYATMLLAREKEYFISIYDNNCNPVVAPKHITEDQLEVLFQHKEKLCLVSDVAPDYLDQLPVSFFNLMPEPAIDLKTWCTYAFENFKCNKIVNFSEFEPFYLKQVYTHK